MPISNFIVGPIEVFTMAFDRYLPLTDSGRLRATALMKASTFVCRFSSGKSRFPNLPIIVPFSFTLNSIKPYFDCFTVSIKSSGFTNVPDLTLGMRPLGPSTLANYLRPCICSGVEIILSKLRAAPSEISLSSFSSPMTSHPYSASISWNSLSANTQTRTSLPVPQGSTQVPLTFWSP